MIIRKVVLVLLSVMGLNLLTACQNEADNSNIALALAAIKSQNNLPSDEICSERAYIVADNYSEDWLRAIYSRFPNHGPFVEGQTKIIIAYTLPKEMDILCLNEDGIVLQVRPDVNQIWGLNYKTFNWYDEEIDEDTDEPSESQVETTPNVLTSEMMEQLKAEDEKLNALDTENQWPPMDTTDQEFKYAYRRLGDVMPWIKTSSEVNTSSFSTDTNNSRALSNESKSTYPISSICRNASCIWAKDKYRIGHAKTAETTGGSWTVNFKITPIRISDSTNGNDGHYVMVEADSRIDAKGMWQGRRVYKYYAAVFIWERLVGPYLKRFSITYKPIARKKKKSASDSDIFYPVTIYGAIQPDTVNNKTTYQLNSHWDLSFGASASLEAGIGEEDSKHKYNLTGKGQLESKWSFGESLTKTYTISDMSIENNSGAYVDGHENNNFYAAFTGKVNNLPEFKWSEDRGLTEGSSTCQAGFNMHSTWLWYIPTTEDIELDVSVKGEPIFGAGWFYSTEADYKTKEFNGIGDQTITVKFPTVGNMDYGRYVYTPPASPKKEGDTAK